MLIKPGSLAHRYLPNEMAGFNAKFNQILKDLNGIGHTDIYQCPRKGEDNSGVYHVVLTPKHKGDMMANHVWTVQHKIDYYNCAAHLNCVLNQIDIFIQYTLI